MVAGTESLERSVQIRFAAVKKTSRIGIYGDGDGCGIDTACTWLGVEASVLLAILCELRSIRGCSQDRWISPSFMAYWVRIFRSRRNQKT